MKAASGHQCMGLCAREGTPNNVKYLQYRRCCLIQPNVASLAAFASSDILPSSHCF